MMAVTVDPKSNKLIIRFRVKGYEKQFYLSTGLKDNKSNRVIVESRWELIQREISLGEFDYSLERYKSKGVARHLVIVTPSSFLRRYSTHSLLKINIFIRAIALTLSASRIFFATQLLLE